jgi:hypothetical protein
MGDLISIGGGGNEALVYDQLHCPYCDWPNFMLFTTEEDGLFATCCGCGDHTVLGVYIEPEDNNNE